jgi:high-affinity iron transporter
LARLANRLKYHWLTPLMIVALVLALNGANFLVYFTGYWSQSGAVQPLLLGLILGLGICISIGILLYFSVLFSDQNLTPYTSAFLLVLYGAGQLMQASNRLLQIDRFPDGKLLWDANWLIKESSELGHFLTALFGYDATPTSLQLTLYLTAVAVPLVIFIMVVKRGGFKTPTQHKQANPETSV